MFTQSLKIEVRGSNERVYRFDCDPSSPLGEINDALSTMKSVVLKQMNEQHDRELKEANPPLQECCKQNEECSKEYEECCKSGGDL